MPDSLKKEWGTWKTYMRKAGWLSYMSVGLQRISSATLALNVQIQGPGY